jgi:hypothetical protein
LDREYDKKYYRLNKELCKQRAKAWRDANPEKCRVNRRQWFKKNRAKMYVKKLAFLRRKRGWFGTDFSDALIVQNNKCAICEKPFSRKNEIHADHDHKTGKRRGLLCMVCNVRLGSFEKNRELFEIKFPRYLRSWQTI